MLLIKHILPLSLGLAIVIFAIDLYLPLGVAGGVPFILPVLLASWSPKNYAVPLLAILATLLTGAGLFLSPEGGEAWMVATNRGLAVGAIWVTAGLSTVRRKSEAQTRESLRQKEILLAEIHHRIKNNLQIVAALLELQSAKMADDTLTRALETTRSRILSIAALHENLYRTADLETVDAEKYLQAIMEGLEQTFTIAENPVAIELQVTRRSISLEEATPVGLIVSELVTNAYKYAFSGQDGSKVSVAFYSAPDGCHLVVSDNGIGMAPERSAGDAKTLGLELVKNLVEQLHGTLEIKVHGGTRFHIIFPVQV